MTRTPSLLLLLSCCTLLAGCAMTAPTASTSHVALAGVVHGGQQPVSGATIQLYAVGATGDGSAATPLIATPPTTDAGGGFNITGDYTCPSGSPQVYIVATGGNPGLGAGGSNPQIALMSALGPCGSYGPASFININELTTVAGVYALAPYMTSITSVGSGPSDASQLSSAFTLASELVNVGSGTAPGVNVPSGLTVPIAQVNTIADITASCINSPGGVSGDTSLCGQFFAMTLPSGGTTSTNTISALLDLALNPALNTPSLFALAATSPPFQPTDSTPPPDLSINLTPAAPSVLTFSTPQIYVPSGGSSIITLTNTGATSISIASFAASAGFSQTNTCGASLALSATCAVTVSAATTTQTPFNGTLAVTSSASTTAQIINLVTAQNVVNFGSATLYSSASYTYYDYCTNLAEGYCQAIPTIGGTNPLDFPRAGCLISGGMTCSGTVNFVPTAVGERFATYIDTAYLSTHAAPYLLVGYGVPSTGQVISFSASTFTLNLGTGIGTNPPPASVTLTNTGNQPVSFGTFATYPTAGNDDPYAVFSQSNTCGSSLAVGATCTVTVSVSGLTIQPGPFAGILTITSNSVTPTVTIGISGVVAPNGGVLALSSQALYVPSSTGSSTTFEDLTNAGATPIAIASISTSSSFSQTNDCGSTLAPGATCVVSLSASTTSNTIPITGTLTISSSASVPTQTVPLYTAQNEQVSFGSTISNFGSSVVGILDPTIMTYYSGSGYPGLFGAITGPNASDFGFVGGISQCTGNECIVRTNFTPDQSGYRIAVLSFQGPSTFLVGFGVPSGAQNTVTFSPASLTFPQTAINAVSSTQTFTITNPAGHLLNIAVNSATLPAQFQVSPSTCAAVTCTVSVTFTPTAVVNGGTQASVLILDSVTNQTPAATLIVYGTGSPVGP